MSAATANDPGVNVQKPAARQARCGLPSERFNELSNIAYAHGDFGYVANAVEANHEGMKQFFAG